MFLCRYTLDIGDLEDYHVVNLVAHKSIRFTTSTLSILQRKIQQIFFDTHRLGMRLYLGGEWGRALQMFDKVLKIRCVDSCMRFARSLSFFYASCAYASCALW